MTHFFFFPFARKSENPKSSSVLRSDIKKNIENKIKTSTNSSKREGEGRAKTTGGNTHKTASLFREDAKNMEAAGDALGGVTTADIKTVKQVCSKSDLVVVWYGEEDTEVSGSEGRESSQTASAREDTQNMEAEVDEQPMIKL